jgi:hypothetical protein
MSNSLAIATVTATLALQILTPAAKAASLGATVTTVRPDSAGGTTAPRINLYLFQITPNAAWRNRDLPTRTADSQLIQRPRVALDLHYLLTFYGDESKLHAQRLLGNAVRAMHDKPVLTRQMIRNTIASPTYSFLALSNLEEEVELVKFTPLLLSLEELTKIWSVFFQTRYTLSIAYQGTVVLIESEDTVSPALPVQKPKIYTIPFRHPVVERVYSAAGITQPITAKSELVIEGRQLKGDITQVRIAGSNTLSPSKISDAKITLSLASAPAGSLRAGVQGLQVVQPLLIGEPPAPHTGFESNVAPFVLRPEIKPVGSPTSREVVITTDLVIGKDQRLLLLLNENSAAVPESYSFPVEPRPSDSKNLTIPISAVKAAEYFVRLQVDGAESLLDLDPTSITFGPRVTIP